VHVPVSLPPLNHIRLGLNSLASFRRWATRFSSRPTPCEHIQAAQSPIRPLVTSHKLLCSRCRVDVALGHDRRACESSTDTVQQYCWHADSGGMHAFVDHPAVILSPGSCSTLRCVRAPPAPPARQNTWGAHRRPCCGAPLRRRGTLGAISSA
jgi:hypothetical protein